MVCCQTLRGLAWGPCSTGPIGTRGYRERHVYRVAGCPQYQFLRSLRWQPRPVRVAVLAQEVLQKEPEENFKFNGASVDCLQTHGNQPVTPDTLSVHAGEREGRPRVADSLTTPIVQTATYTFRSALAALWILAYSHLALAWIHYPWLHRDTAELIAYQEGRYGSYEYGRYGNPTTRTCEEKIRCLEGAEDCLVSASGMNSATTMLLALVPAGGHIVTTTDCYRRTRQFIQTVCQLS